MPFRHATITIVIKHIPQAPSFKKNESFDCAGFAGQLEIDPGPQRRVAVVRRCFCCEELLPVLDGPLPRMSAKEYLVVRASAAAPAQRFLKLNSCRKRPCPVVISVKKTHGLQICVTSRPSPDVVWRVQPNRTELTPGYGSVNMFCLTFCSARRKRVASPRSAKLAELWKFEILRTSANRQQWSYLETRALCGAKVKKKHCCELGVAQSSNYDNTVPRRSTEYRTQQNLTDGTRQPRRENALRFLILLFRGAPDVARQRIWFISIPRRSFCHSRSTRPLTRQQSGGKLGYSGARTTVLRFLAENLSNGGRRNP